MAWPPSPHPTCGSFRKIRAARPGKNRVQKKFCDDLHEKLRVTSADLAPSTSKPETWRKEIAAFEKQDAESPPPRDAVLLVGSSSIRLWDAAKWFPDVPTINRGFGGSQMCDSTQFADGA